MFSDCDCFTCAQLQCFKACFLCRGLHLCSQHPLLPDFHVLPAGVSHAVIPGRLPSEKRCTTSPGCNTKQHAAAPELKQPICSFFYTFCPSLANNSSDDTSTIPIGIANSTQSLNSLHGSACKLSLPQLSTRGRNRLVFLHAISVGNSMFRAQEHTVNCLSSSAVPSMIINGTAQHTDPCRTSCSVVMLHWLSLLDHHDDHA
jgi:hypothetical protein